MAAAGHRGGHGWRCDDGRGAARPVGRCWWHQPPALMVGGAGSYREAYAAQMPLLQWVTGHNYIFSLVILNEDGATRLNISRLRS